VVSVGAFFVGYRLPRMRQNPTYKYPQSNHYPPPLGVVAADFRLCWNSNPVARVQELCKDHPMYNKEVDNRYPNKMESIIRVKTTT